MLDKTSASDCLSRLSLPCLLPRPLQRSCESRTVSAAGISPRKRDGVAGAPLGSVATNERISRALAREKATYASLLSSSSASSVPPPPPSAVSAALLGHSPSFIRTTRTVGHSRPFEPWIVQRVSASRAASSAAASCSSDNSSSLSRSARSRLRALLDRLELLSLEQDAAAEEAARDALTLCTIHGSKGLEWPTVLVVRMNEGECPSSAALTADGGGGGTDEALEDERRLAYVAFSRAKARLILSFVATEPSGAPATPSRFLGEIPAALTVRDSQLR
mmetsp:Transcript_24356/g.78614  ORF Transcript_24356/g.78614 Transcript_24356/m.78614 type:complete len:277 (+) Transcript_24356:125-955(+)